jgi:hypothetical protein
MGDFYRRHVISALDKDQPVGSLAGGSVMERSIDGECHGTVRQQSESGLSTAQRHT